MSDLFQRLTEPVTDHPTAIQPLRISRFTLLSDRALPLPDGLTQPVHPPHAVEDVNQWTGSTLPAPLIAEAAAQSLAGALPSFRQIGRMGVGDGAPSAQPVRLGAAEPANEAESAESIASAPSPNLAQNVYSAAEMTPIQAAAPINKPQLDPVNNEPLATADLVHELESSSRVQPASAGMNQVMAAPAIANLGETGANTAPVTQHAPVDATVQRKMTPQPDAAPLTPGVSASNVQPMTLVGQPQAGAISSTLAGFEPTPQTISPRVVDELGEGGIATPSSPQPPRSAANRPASPEQAGRAVFETSSLVQPALSAPTIVPPSDEETPSSQAENASDLLGQTQRTEEGIQRQNEVTVAPLLEPARTLPQRSQHDVSPNVGETAPEPAKVSTAQTATNTPSTQATQDLPRSLPARQPDLGQVVGQAASSEISPPAEPGLLTPLGTTQAQVEPRLQPFAPLESNLFERADGRAKRAEAVTATPALADETVKTSLTQPQPLPPLASASTIQAPQTSSQAAAMQTPALGQPRQPQADQEAAVLPKPQPLTPQGDEASMGGTKASTVKGELLERSVKSPPTVEPAISNVAGLTPENTPRAQIAPRPLDDQVNVSAPGRQPVQRSSPQAEANPAPAASPNREGVIHPAVQALQATVQNEAILTTPSLGATQPLHSTPNQPVSPPDSTVAPLLLTPAQRERMGTSEKPVTQLEQAVKQAAMAKEAQMPGAYQQQSEGPRYGLRAPAAQPEPMIQERVTQVERLVAQQSAPQTEPSQPAQNNTPIAPVLRNVAVQQPSAKVIAAPLAEELAIAQPVRSSQGVSRSVAQPLGVEPLANPASAEARAADTATVQPHFENFAPKRKPTAPPEPQPLPTIHVTIGRVIVQTTPAQPKPTAPQRRTAQPPLSLDAYLQQRAREVS